jgi:epoxyqueuosine reductase
MGGMETLIDELKGLLSQAGFAAFRIFDPARAASLMADVCTGGHADPAAAERLLSLRCPVLIAAFPVPSEAAVPPARATGRIAPFACRNYYREAVRRLDLISVRRTGRHSPLAFSNSRLPEKLLAAVSSLGFYGKQSLIISPGLGTRFILAGMALPDFGPAPGCLRPEYGSLCGDCRACMVSCPAGAIREPGAVDRTRCLQGLASEYRILPDFALEAWGDLLYGCDICQAICPHNQALSVSPQTVEDGPVPGSIGPFVSLEAVLSAGLSGPGALKRFFSGTALGASFLDPRCFVRNSLVAAAHAGAAELIPLIAAYHSSGDEVLSRTAAWALERLA